MSSMYSQCSDQYWKERRKVHSKINVRTMITGLSILFSLSCFSGFRIRNVRRIKMQQKQEQRKRRLESIVKPNPTENHYRRCEAEVTNLLNLECNELCMNERKSIPRLVMHEACIHGCTSSITPSAFSGCRQVSEDDVFRKFGNQVYAQCSRFQNTNPRPDVYSTCRKYHREGIKRGRILGLEKLDEILNVELVEVRRQIEMEDILLLS